jgi:hypothetical protein
VKNWGNVENSLRFWDLWPVLLVLVLLGVFVAVLAWGPWTIDNAADLGEAFGIINAVFTGLAFAGLIITILIQARELRLQREQLALQREELASQRDELRRLANAQDDQNYALLVSAFAAAEAFEQRLSSSSPSQEFAEAIRYLRTHLKAETARRREIGA